ncbi:MAG: Gfo/Idh/MocA family oxidoreductase [Pseudomonadota bacterium]
MAEQLRAGVAGAGIFGGYHANKYKEVDGAALVGVFDLDPQRAQIGAADKGVAAFSNYDVFLAAVDIVTIATPASTHGALAEAALDAGKHVLVEKPIALDVAVADRLIGLAEVNGLILQVGHQERYVADAMGLLARGTPQSLRSRRLNKYSGRAMDVSVVFDLMIHDLDLLAQFGAIEDAELMRIDARFVHGDKADFVAVELLLRSGFTASLSASRLEETPVRDLLLTYPDGELGLDFLGRMSRNTTPTPLPVAMDAQEKPAPLADPLRFGTQAFVNSVRTGTPPPVSGRDGRAALHLALKIEEAAIASIGV